jgi:hypothetical protein
VNYGYTTSNVPANNYANNVVTNPGYTTTNAVSSPVYTTNLAGNNNYGYTTSNVNVGSNAYGNYGYVEPVRTVNYTNTANYQPITTAPTNVSTVQNVLNTQHTLDE